MDQSAAVVQGTICFPVPWGRFWARTDDGAGLWEGHATNEITSSLVVSQQGLVYFSCGKWVQALQPPTPLQPAKSSWPMFRADARHTGRVQMIQ